MTSGDGTYFFYAHLSTFAPGLSVGSAVKAGQILGQIGKTGDASIPHLHFEVHPGGGASINPTPTVKAVDGCKNTAVPPQPNGIPVHDPDDGAGTDGAADRGPNTNAHGSDGSDDNRPAVRAGAGSPPRQRTRAADCTSTPRRPHGLRVANSA